jgi:hypothetical protein
VRVGQYEAGWLNPALTQFVKTPHRAEHAGHVLLAGRDGFEGGFGFEVHRNGDLVLRYKTRTLLDAKTSAELIAEMPLEKQKEWTDRLHFHALTGL